MLYTIRPTYKTTIENLATRLCDIIAGRGLSPTPGQKNDGSPDLDKWDITGLNNRWLRPTTEPGVWKLSCRSPLKPELVRFLAATLGEVTEMGIKTSTIKIPGTTDDDKGTQESPWDDPVVIQRNPKDGVQP